MIEKIFSILWDAINPQKNLDKHYDKLIKDKISQRRKEQLIERVTTAKIIYGMWELALLTLILIFIGIHFINP